MNAAAGSVCIYARVPRLSKGGVGERARQLHAAGIVRLLPQRPFADGLFDYRVERTGAPFEVPVQSCDDSALRWDERMLLELLVGIADDDRPCPSDRDLAALLGLKTERAAQRLLSQLRHRGAIRSELFGAEGGSTVRVVTIMETGARTWRPEKA